MRTNLFPTSFARVAPAFLLALAGFFLSPSAHAQVSKWNAYKDFYFDSTSTNNNVQSWPGSKYPSGASSAWGYYIVNANTTGGFPDRIGYYFPPGNDLSLKQALYAMANYQPVGVGQQQAGGFSGANDAWYGTGGKGTPVYVDRYGLGSQIGSFDVPWYDGAPACSGGGIWMRASYLGNPGGEGICPVLIWKAPADGNYSFSGSFVAGTDGSGASVAVVDSFGGLPLARTPLSPGGTQTFNFNKVLKQGDVVQFQVGTDYKAGAPVGLNVDVALIEVTSWDAFSDFYFDSTSTNNSVSSWTGAKSPSPAGKAWGYYIANANGGSFPSQIGSYFAPGAIINGTNQALYAMANHKPLGVGNEQAAGFSGAADIWYGTGGRGTPVYQDKYGFGSQIGSFDVSWYAGAPACPNGGIWIRPKYLENPNAEGICPVVTWTAPYAGIYKFQGSFVAGTDGSGVSVAVVDSTGGLPLARTPLTPGNSQTFSFTKILNPGDVIQFQAGSDYKAAAPLGLNVTVSQIQQNFTAFGDFWMSGRMISPVPEGLSDGGPAAWANMVDATIQGRSPNTPTYPNAWSYGVINCTGGNPSANDFQPTSITGENPEGAIYRAAWQQFFSLEDGVTGIYAAGVPLWSYQSNGAQVGWYGSAWYFDAPGNDGNGAGRNGLSTSPNSNKNYLWMKVGPGASDGVASVVRWTAPANGTYRFKGEFLPGGNGPGTMSTAVLTYNNPDLVEGTDTIVLNRQTLAHDGDARQFDFNLTVVQGQTVSWVVGADGDATGDVMGLQADVTPVPSGAVEKITPVITELPTASGIIAGQALTNSTISGGNITPSGGTWAWSDPGNTNTVAGTNSYAAVYTPALGDQANYSTLTNNLTVVVTAASGPAAPSNLTYSPSSSDATHGQPITNMVASVSNTVTGYTISPALPAGLSINSTNGTISGTPTAVAASASYTVTATNSAGSTTASVTIAVTDRTAPLITLNGSTPLTVAWGSVYSDAGATATDNVDGSVTVNSSGSVNTSAPGTYTITYSAIDAAGNPAILVSRSVTVSVPANTGGSDGLSPLMRFAFGGADSNSIVTRPSSALSGSNLVLTAIVRTNQTNLSVVGQWVTNVSSFTNPPSTNTVIGSAIGVSQTNVPAGCQRQTFTVPQGSDTRKFLRLKVSM